jgi:adenine-specific DNA methylase
VDPMCGIGTTLVEAVTLGCRAVGVELEPRWAELARANLTHAVPADRAALAEVRVGDARQLGELLADLTGRVDLLVTRILELQASNTPMSDAEKAKVAQRDRGCPDVGREPHDQRVLARTELGLPPRGGRPCRARSLPR